MKRLIVLMFTLVSTPSYSAIDIFQAIKNNKLNQVKKNLNENPENLHALYASPEVHEEIYPIHQAAISNSDARILDLLLSKGARVDEPSQTGKTAFYFAKAHNNNVIMNFLRSRGATEDFMPCPICTEDKLLQDFTILSCNDMFCKNCLNDLAKLSIKEQNPNLLQCPTCKQAFSQEDIQNVVSKKQQVKIADIQAKKIPGLKHCPTPGCQNQFLVDDSNLFHITCPSCNESYCSNCFLPHNPLQSPCQQAQSKHTPLSEEMLRNFIKEGTKPCPQCTTPITKIAGCEHVICSNCKKEFCFRCYGSHHELYCENTEVNPYQQQLAKISSQPVKLPDTAYLRFETQFPHLRDDYKNFVNQYPRLAQAYLSFASQHPALAHRYLLFAQQTSSFLVHQYLEFTEFYPEFAEKLLNLATSHPILAHHYLIFAKKHPILAPDCLDLAIKKHNLAFNYLLFTETHPDLAQFELERLLSNQ